MTLLLESVLTWVRRQTGTTSLRALLYFDEVFGFFPPTAEPPSKRPLLTLLKQARAFGLGTVLVTQNPVDIDYKGLTNAGTWFIGKLQAERDKARVPQGLKGAIAEAGGTESVDYDSIISRLSSRVFLMHNVHEDRPVVFHTRWVMSYLRGPLTRPQIRTLMGDREPAASAEEAPPAVSAPAAAAATAPVSYTDAPPSLDPSVAQVFLPVKVSEQAAVREVGQAKVEAVQLLYEPAVVGGGTVRFIDRKREVDERTERVLLAQAPGDIGGVAWGRAESLPLRLNDLTMGPERVGEQQGPFYSEVPESANTERELKSLGKDLSDWLYYNSRLTLTVHPELDIFRHPDESERDFKARLQQAARERRDKEVDELEGKYGPKLDRIRDKLRKEQQELAEDQAEYEARKQEEIIGIGETVVGFFLGRRSTRSVSRAATKRRMTAKAQADIQESQEEIADLQAEMDEIEQELQDEVAEITSRWESVLDDLTTEDVTPRRTDVDVRLTALAWVPYWRIVSEEGAQTVPAYALTEQQ